MRKYKLSINDNSYEVIVKEVTETHARVEVNGEDHTVAIDEIQSLVLPETIPPSPVHEPLPSVTDTVTVATVVSAGGVIAPMPGQIRSIFVREGDRVKAGQKLLIMEAMKLENKIAAPRAGLIQKILVRDGDIVSQGQEMVIIV